jgi:adenosylcobinamide-GDP ribazoletransferase
VPRALVAAHVLARWSSLPLLWHYPYVRRTGGTGKPFAAGVDRFRLAVGTAAALAIAAAALGWRAVPAVAAAGLATMLAGRDFRRRLGGITGDCLGAANQLVELAVYLVLAARLPSFLPMAFR